MPISLSAEYASLPPQCFSQLNPTPVKAPSVIAVNDALAEVLGLSAEALRSGEGVALLAGNAVPSGLSPLAMAYSGHQFGHWAGQLGDGRALLLGEAAATDGQVYDIQLKGAGRTPYSRSGDGRSALGPVIREYIVSEAMAALGVPTTRALGAVRTGEMVLRENRLPGGILTRVAKAHVRVGTFQHFASRQDTEALAALTDFCITRLYPDQSLGGTAENAAFLLYQTVCAQAQLIAKWMGLGFIHGVMNTDNMAISGETIDYGPCAFMERYDPETVFSSIDHQGRYAYMNQPNIGHWNLACLASALIPLLDEDEDTAVKTAQDILDQYQARYETAYDAVMRAKLGLKAGPEPTLLAGLLEWMKESEADFTNTFRSLSTGQLDMRQDDRLSLLKMRWEAENWSERQSAMLAANPAFIPRNHQVEKAIRAAVDVGDDAPFHALNAVLKAPYADQPDAQEFARPAEPEEMVRQTFCGT